MVVFHVVDAVVELLVIGCVLEVVHSLRHDATTVFILGVIQTVDTSQSKLKADFLSINSCFDANTMHLEM
jgi:ABC-type iron transport system FetAB permease component